MDVARTPTYRLYKRRRASSSSSRSSALSRSTPRLLLSTARGLARATRILSAKRYRVPEATLKNHDDARDVAQLSGVIGRYRPVNAQGTYNYHQTWTRTLSNLPGEQAAVDLWRFYDSYQFILPSTPLNVSEAPYNTDSWFSLDPFRLTTSNIGDGVPVGNNPTTTTEQTTGDNTIGLSGASPGLDQTIFVSHVVNEMQFENRNSAPVQIDVLWFRTRKDAKRSCSQLWNDCTSLDSAGETLTASVPPRSGGLFTMTEGRAVVQTYGTSPMMYASFNKYYGVAKRYRFFLAGGSIKKINTTLYVSRYVSRKMINEKNQETTAPTALAGISYEVLVVMRPLVITEYETGGANPKPGIPGCSINVFGWNRHVFKSIKPRGKFAYTRVATGHSFVATGAQRKHIDDSGDVQDLVLA